jgi:hypothetical protein
MYLSQASLIDRIYYLAGTGDLCLIIGYQTSVD